MRFFYITILIFLNSFWAYSQNDAVSEETDKPDFLKSVQMDLATLNSEKGEGVSLFFQNYWNQDNLFTDSNRKKIKEIYGKMVDQNFSVREYRLPFISTLSGGASNLKDPAAAINSFLETIERAFEELESRQFKELLRVTEQILEKKAIFYSKYYQVVFSDGSVSFEWPSEPEVEVFEEVSEPAEEAETDTWGSESNDDWGSDDGWGESEDDGWGNDDNWGEESADANAGQQAEEVDAPAAIYSEPMPTLQGPIVKLRNINLKFLTSTDSVKINNVTGSMELIGSTFVAEGGELTWEHLGVAPDQLYAELADFTFEVNKKDFYAEQSTLHYPAIVKRPVKGIVEFKAETRSNRPSTYPYFQSYASDYDLNFVDKQGLYVKGGVTLKGKTLSTASMDSGFGSIELQGQALKKI